MLALCRRFDQQVVIVSEPEKVRPSSNLGEPFIDFSRVPKNTPHS
ncbi:hypothetical protein IMCC14465_09040 [alpha proteobacterium IMCC14465]|uniref:Uncharacterized protein n=1 Tax=alpha proteobacterium IMCC14465 TaxID=1220535 RepID=J9DG70_9PROT|nr:hypothetical protein IMCC14465_09040 [alpha proteobacterium IMCC14465]